MIATENSIRIAGIVHDSIVDGPGLRMAVFVQGCNRGCKGCHNPESWPLGGGREVSADGLLAEADKNPLLTGVTISGGEPLLRAGALIPFAEGVWSRGLDLAIYTGYVFEDVVTDGDEAAVLLIGYATVLVDGPFVLEQKSLLLRFRGSSNQRVLDSRASLASGRAVMSEDPSWI